MHRTLHETAKLLLSGQPQLLCGSTRARSSAETMEAVPSPRTSPLATTTMSCRWLAGCARAQACITPGSLRKGLLVRGKCPSWLTQVHSNPGHMQGFLYPKIMRGMLEACSHACMLRHTHYGTAPPLAHPLAKYYASSSRTKHAQGTPCRAHSTLT